MNAPLKLDPSLPHELVVMHWLRQVALTNSRGINTELSCLALTAFNCMNRQWMHTNVRGTGEDHAHAVHPYWHADLSWFGEDFPKLIQQRNGVYYVPLRAQYLALASFSRHLTSRYNGTLKSLEMWVDTNTNKDTREVCHFLGLFHPMRNMMTIEEVSTREGVLRLFEETRNDIQKLPHRTTNSWWHELDVGSSILVVCAALRLYLEPRMVPAAPVPA